MDREHSLADLLTLIEEDAQAVGTIRDYLRKRDGGLGLLLCVLRRRPEIFVPHVLQSVQVYDAPKAIDPKTAELAAVEEIFDVLLVAGAIAESSVMSVAFRQFRQLEGKDHPEGE